MTPRQARGATRRSAWKNTPTNHADAKGRGRPSERRHAQRARLCEVGAQDREQLAARSGDILVVKRPLPLRHAISTAGQDLERLAEGRTRTFLRGLMVATTADVAAPTRAGVETRARKR